MEDRRRCNQPKNPTPILLQGSLSAALPLYIFGAASSLAGVVAALGLTESLGSPLPNNFEVTGDPILDCTFDNQPCLGLGEDEGERKAYLEVHLAKEEEEGEKGGRGGGGGGGEGGGVVE